MNSFRKALIMTLILVLISPIFGVILADSVGFREPLDLVAEALNLQDWSESLNWTPLFDYTVPGLPAEVGYIVSGIIGIAIILVIGLAINRLASRRMD